MLKNITYRLFPFLIISCLFFPMLKENISSITVGVLIVNTLLYRLSTKDFKINSSKIILLTIPFWIIVFTSMFSTNINLSLSHINHGLLFLLIPLVFTYIPKEIFTEKRMELFIFSLKNIGLAMAVIYLSKYFIDTPAWRFSMNFYNESTFRNYVYKEFTWFKIHPTYYTTILIFGAVHSLNLVLQQKKYLQLIYVVSFIGITFLLLTKLTTVLMVSLLFYMLLFKNPISVYYKGLVLGFSVLGIGALVLFTPGVKNRFMELYHSVNVKPIDKTFDSTNIRKAIFDCSVDLFQENWVRGVGFENLQLELNNCYKSNYNSDFYKDHDYMTHNYYLYIFISSGFLGFLFFLIYLANIVRISFKSRIFLFQSFIFTILIVCFIEDFLYRQNGILYFNLLVMCFIKYIENNESNVLNQLD